MSNPFKKLSPRTQWILLTLAMLALGAIGFTLAILAANGVI